MTAPDPGRRSPKHTSSLAYHPDIAMVLPLFIARLPEVVGELRAHWTAQDRDRLQGLAHQLKGSGKSYGFAEITIRAAAFEGALLAGQSLPAVQTYFEALVGYLQDIEGYAEAP